MSYDSNRFKNKQNSMIANSEICTTGRIRLESVIKNSLLPNRSKSKHTNFKIFWKFKISDRSNSKFLWCLKITSFIKIVAIVFVVYGFLYKHLDRTLIVYVELNVFVYCVSYSFEHVTFEHQSSFIGRTYWQKEKWINIFVMYGYVLITNMYHKFQKISRKAC